MDLAPSPSASSLHDQDFHAWTLEQAALLRAGRLAEADALNIAEEIEALGRSERRELVSRLAVLLAHLLKWSAQPSHRGQRWALSVREQRRQIGRLLGENPSLRARLDVAVAEAYGDALLMAQRETGLSAEGFPTSCQMSQTDILSDLWMPE